MNPQQKILAFDGLRGLAIIAVLFFHLQIPGAQLGWAGVPLFFVLSGFLITRILLNSRTQPDYFRNFFIRRALRIFPVYYLVLGLTAAFTFLKWHENNHGWQWFAIYLQNNWIGQNGLHSTFSTMLSHTWSLAVEEQFYLIWPFIVYFLSRKALAVVSVTLVILAALVRLYYLNINPLPIMPGVNSLCQMDGLAMGSLVAIGLHGDDHGKAHYSAGMAVMVGAVVIALLMVWHTGYSQFGRTAEWMRMPGNFMFNTVLNLLFAAAVLVAVTGGHAGILKHTALAYTGKISYGIYLYHLIGFAIAEKIYRMAFKVEATGLTGYARKIAVAYLLAVISFHFFEQRLLKLKDQLAPARTS